MTQMVTKTELYALDLSSFTKTVESLDDQLRANQEKLDDIAHAKEIISSSLEGQSAQAMITSLRSNRRRRPSPPTAPPSSSSNEMLSIALMTLNSTITRSPTTG